jgi:hypothetical protein
MAAHISSLGDPMALFQMTLARARETRSFCIEHVPAAGWRTSKLANDRLTHQQHRTEWHRVERDAARFVLEIEALRRQGWRDA